VKNQHPLWELGNNIRAFLEGYLNSNNNNDQAEIVDGSPARKSPFPKAGIDAFLSHFVLTLELQKGGLAGQIINLTLPAAIQIVSRSDAAPHKGGAIEHTAHFPLPKGCSLANKFSDRDLLDSPPNFFQAGKETVWLQILDLDARANTEYGPIRIILGETFKREYPEIFQPSFGAAQSIGPSGFPARLFFSPNAVIETPLGAFKTRPKALVADTVSRFPPVGGSPRLQHPVALDNVELLRKRGLEHVEAEQPDARILALAHPIDADIPSGSITPDEIFQKISANTLRGKPPGK